MVAPTRIGEGIKMNIDLAMRAAILQYIYEAGKPLPSTQLASFVCGPGMPWAPFQALINTLDVLARMVNNGDLIIDEKKRNGWQVDNYYLSAREFVRMTDAANRPAGQQAIKAACRRVWRFLRRLCGR